MNRRKVIALITACSILSTMPKFYIQKGITYVIPEDNMKLTQEKLEEDKTKKKLR